MIRSSTPTETLYALDAQNVKVWRDFSMGDISLLPNLGISLDTPQLANSLMKSGIGMDTIQGNLTTASMVTPVQFLQSWAPGFVEIITAARKIDEIIGYTVMGEWKSEQIVQAVLENSAFVAEYEDLSNTTFSNWNANFVYRTVVRSESGIRVGILEEERAASIRVNSGDMKRASAALGLEQQRNAIGFYGYNAGNNNTYGFLNDPNLPSYVQVASGTGGYLWSQKTFVEICADIRTAVVALRTGSQDTIDPERTPLTLALPSAVVDYLSQISSLGYSVRQWLKETYPNIRIVSAPQLNSAYSTSNVFYLFADKVEGSTDGGKTFEQFVPAKFYMLGVQKLTKGYEESYSNATAGVMCKRPFAVVRYYGI